MLENPSTSDSFYFDQNSNQIKDILKYVTSIFVNAFILFFLKSDDAFIILILNDN